MFRCCPSTRTVTLSGTFEKCLSSPFSIFTTRLLPETYSTSPRSIFTSWVGSPWATVLLVCTCAATGQKEAIQTAPTTSTPRIMLRESLTDFIVSLLFVFSPVLIPTSSCLIRLARIPSCRGDDETLRRAANKIERKARNQREGRYDRRRQNICVFRIHDFRLFDDVLLGFSTFIQQNNVPLLDVLENTKKTVPMARDSQIPRLTYTRSAFDAAHTPIQGEFVRTIEDWRLQV